MKNKDNEKTMKANTCRTIVNVPLDMDEKFRDLAVKRGIAKSQMILFAMGWYLDYSNSMDLMPKIIDTLKKANDLESESKNI